MFDKDDISKLKLYLGSLTARRGNIMFLNIVDKTNEYLISNMEPDVLIKYCEPEFVIHNLTVKDSSLNKRITKLLSVLPIPADYFVIKIKSLLEVLNAVKWDDTKLNISIDQNKIICNNAKSETEKILGYPLLSFQVVKFLKDFYEFYKVIPALDTWTQKADGPGSRHSHTMTTIGDELYVFGGSPSTGSYHSELPVYDIPTNTWSIPVDTNVPTARYRHGAIGDANFISKPVDSTHLKNGIITTTFTPDEFNIEDTMFKEFKIRLVDGGETVSYKEFVSKQKDDYAFNIVAWKREHYIEYGSIYVDKVIEVRSTRPHLRIYTKPKNRRK